MAALSIGRTVHYQLSSKDAAEILRRRTDGKSIAARIKDNKWPLGAQAHIGTPPAVGDLVSMVVTHVVTGTMTCNGQCTLDGNDSLWVQGVEFGDQPGQWQWPEMQR